VRSGVVALAQALRSLCDSEKVEASRPKALRTVDALRTLAATEGRRPL
jgi:hypothetical protein